MKTIFEDPNKAKQHGTLECTLSFRLTKKDAEKFKAYCDKEGYHKGDLIRLALREFIRKQ